MEEKFFGVEIVRQGEQTLMRNEKIKAIAIDLDGTLLDSRQRISEYTKKVLEECKNRGIKLVIATGRNHFSARKLVEGIEGVSFVSNNGSLIVDEKGEILREREISGETTREILKKSKEVGKLYYFLVSPDRLLMPPARKGLCKPLIKHLFSWKGFMEYLDNRKIVPRVKTRNIEEYLTQNNFKVQKINFLGDPNRVLELEKRVEDFNLAITRGHEWSIDINPPGVNKGEALKFLINHWGIPEEGLMAFGDGSNDFEMIGFAGTGVVMDNSNLGILRETADLIAPSNNDDGVARMIEKVVLAEG